jgi:hypothetical protein
MAGGLVKVAGAWLTAMACVASTSVQADTAKTAGVLDSPQAQGASVEARRVARWAFGTRDMQGKPFAVVDKKAARIFVFDAEGRLQGATPVLLGLAKGDDSLPGVGRRVRSGIAPQERTTPSGRFESEPGHNDKGEAIVWVDYQAAVAIHRLRPASRTERRPQRLASETPLDNRISLGCIVVAEAFYDSVIAPTLGAQRGVVYVLPETRSPEAEFGIGADDLL